MNRDRSSSPPHTSPPLTEAGRKLAPLIDHTLLKPDATEQKVELLCAEALKYGFASVCVNPALARAASRCLAGSPVKVCVVAGFPLGATVTPAKCRETESAIQDGAREIDMVMSIWAAKQGNWFMVEHDIQQVVRAAAGIPVKVILETCLLTDEEKRTACRVAVTVGAQFVKTSTGFSTGGATVADVRLLRACVGPKFGVKASGGIKTTQSALQMVEAGANRLGTSASVAIVTGSV